MSLQSSSVRLDMADSNGRRSTQEPEMAIFSESGSGNISLSSEVEREKERMSFKRSSGGLGGLVTDMVSTSTWISMGNVGGAF